jgi:hypothetical protein
MKISPMPMDWYNLHTKNDNTTNWHVQCNSYPNPNDIIHHRDWKHNLKVHLEALKTENSQDNTE